MRRTNGLGRILATGGYSNGSGEVLINVLFDSNGTVPTSQLASSIVTSATFGASAVLQTDGKIVVAGTNDATRTLGDIEWSTPPSRRT